MPMRALKRAPTSSAPAASTAAVDLWEGWGDGLAGPSRETADASDEEEMDLDGMGL